MIELVHAWLLVFWINNGGMIQVQLKTQKECQNVGTELTHQAYGRSNFRCIEINR